MDGSRFDGLARALGRGTSRRGVLRGVVGGLAGLVAAGVASRPDISADGRALVICNPTGNPDVPYQELTIQQAEMNLYARGGAFLKVDCCADSDCANQYGECGSGTCTNGYCVQLPVAGGMPCDAGLACVTSGICDGAFNCTGSGAPVICPDTGNPCTTSICTEEAGGCQTVNLDNGTICGDDNLCFTNSCRDGLCIFFPKNPCGEPTQCIAYTCNPEEGCITNYLTGGSCTTTGGYVGTCNNSGECLPICTLAASCRVDGDCSTGKRCLNGGCFTFAPPDEFCSNECASCFGSYESAFGGDTVCADIDHGFGACNIDAECPSGTYCNPAIATSNPDFEFICTPPCPIQS